MSVPYIQNGKLSFSSFIETILSPSRKVKVIEMDKAWDRLFSGMQYFNVFASTTFFWNAKVIYYQRFLSAQEMQLVSIWQEKYVFLQLQKYSVFVMSI